MDILTKLFVENKVAVYKPNPVNQVVYHFAILLIFVRVIDFLKALIGSHFANGSESVCRTHFGSQYKTEQFID